MGPRALQHIVLPYRMLKKGDGLARLGVLGWMQALLLLLPPFVDGSKGRTSISMSVTCGCRRHRERRQPERKTRT
jgi:hypothetical protein